MFDEAIRLRRSTRAVLLLVSVSIAVSLLLSLAGIGPFRSEPVKVGRLSERARVWDALSMGPLPSLSDATVEWGLDEWAHSGTSQLTGGVAIGDLDNDSRADIIVAGGDATVFFGTDGGRFERARPTFELSGKEVTSVTLGDVDADGSLDILIGVVTGDDAIVWGGDWARLRSPPTAVVTALPGGEPTTGLLSADLTRDGAVDIFRLGYGSSDAPADDVVFEQVEPRHFEPIALPNGDRLSLAAEITDANEDGAPDVWVTRDVGWRTGGDSVYLRDGNGWRDGASALGADLKIDGMGVTVADLTGDGLLDTYLTDVGDNELLAGKGRSFGPANGSGLARIRPPGAEDRLISSSWASGVGDFNLDGKLDLVVVNGGFVRGAVSNKIPDTEIVVHDTPALFLGDGHGRFADVWPLLELDAQGAYRGMSLGDLDSDGDTDIVIIEHGGGITALRNDSTGASLVLRASGACSPSGTSVSLTARGLTVTTLLGAHTFLSSHAPEVIVGTGSGRGASLRVRRPDGTAETRGLVLSGARDTVTIPTCSD